MWKRVQKSPRRHRPIPKHLGLLPGMTRKALLIQKRNTRVLTRVSTPRDSASVWATCASEKPSWTHPVLVVQQQPSICLDSRVFGVKFLAAPNRHAATAKCTWCWNGVLAFRTETSPHCVVPREKRKAIGGPFVAWRISRVNNAIESSTNAISSRNLLKLFSRLGATAKCLWTVLNPTQPLPRGMIQV